MLRLISRTRARAFPSHSRILLHRTFFSTPPPPITPLLDLASTSLPSIEPSFLPLLLAALLFSRDEEESQGSDLHNPPWIVQDQTASGRGWGVVASRGIARGELLIAERPLCCWPQGLTSSQAQELFEQMGEKERKVYMTLARPEGLELSEEGEEGVVLGIRATNGFAVQLPVGGGDNGTNVVSMVFPRISRLNHSCLPTASQAFDFKTLRMEIYTLTPHSPSQEISIEYLPTLITQTHAERQLSLRASFGFKACLCALCTSTPEKRQESDKRRVEIKGLSEGLREGGDRGKMVGSLARMRWLLKEEGYLGLPEFGESVVIRDKPGFWLGSQRGLSHRY